MVGLIFSLGLLYGSYLVWENIKAKKNRSALKHVVYVNGTRGKSSVTRLIASGLAVGGYRVYCKTTGTLPMVINSQGEEKLIHRMAPSNIKEQLKILSWAVLDRADILVIECMALNPYYQYISQHKMLRANIGVITNARLDHTEIMGETTKAIAASLSNTIPKNGVLFTAEKDNLAVFKTVAAANNCPIYPTTEKELTERLSPADFPENIALAVSVCQHLGVNRQQALAAMKDYSKDPFALSFYRLHGGCIFVSALSVNDYQSLKNIYAKVLKPKFNDKNYIVIVNNRSDRGVRTKQMAKAALLFSPTEIWTLGSGNWIFKRSLLAEESSNQLTIKYFKKPSELSFSAADHNTVIVAIGNIGENGKELVSMVEKEGVLYEL